MKFLKNSFSPDRNLFLVKILTLPLLFKMLDMAKLSDNAFSFKCPQKSLAYHFQISSLLALDSSVSFWIFV